MLSYHSQSFSEFKKKKYLRENEADPVFTILEDESRFILLGSVEPT